MTELTPPPEDFHGPTCNGMMMSFGGPIDCDGSCRPATPPRDTTDTEALADLISIGAHEAIRPGEWKTLAAKTVLASDWLATRDAALRAEALREAADALIEARGGQPADCCDHCFQAHKDAALLRERADRIAGGAL